MVDIPAPAIDICLRTLSRLFKHYCSWPTLISSTNITSAGDEPDKADGIINPAFLKVFCNVASEMDFQTISIQQIASNTVIITSSAE